MDLYLYFLFSILDSLAILAIMFKLFRFPFWEYRFEFIVISIIVSLVSYVNRIVLELPAIDTTVQFFLYIVLLRYIIKVRFFHAFFLTAISNTAIACIQFSVYGILLASGIVTILDAQSVHNIGTYVIQASSQITTYLLAFILYRWNLGFSSIMRPPHDLYIHDSLKGTNIWIVIGNTLAALAICTTVYWLLNFNTHLAIIIPGSFISFVTLVYLSYRKEYIRT